MKKKFILNIILLFVLNLLIKPFYVFFIDRTVQNTVGAQEYGLYFAIFSFTFVINIFLDMGIMNYNNRHIAQNSKLLKNVFPPLVTLRFLLAVVYAVVAFSVAAIMGYSSRQFYLLAVLVFNQFLLSFILYLRSNISGLLKFTTDSLISVLDRLLLVIFCLILLYHRYFASNFKIEWFIYAQTMAYTITAIIAFVIVGKDAEFKRLEWNTKLFKEVLRKSFPYATLTLLMQFYYRIDMVLLSNIIPGAEGDMYVGIYAHAYRIIEAFTNFSYLFGVLLLPLFARLISEKKSVKDYIVVSNNALIVFAFTLVGLSFFYSYEIMEVLYKEHIELSAKVLRVLMFTLPAMSLNYIFGALLTANANMKELNLIATIGVIVNVSLNLILIKSYNVIGSAIASVVTQSLVIALQVILVIKMFNKDRKVVTEMITRNMLFIITIFLSGFFILKIQNIEWYYKGLLYLGISGIFALLFKLIDVKGLIAMVLTKEE